MQGRGPVRNPSTELSVDMLTALKAAVDDMRLLLWDYIKTAAESSPEKVCAGQEAQRVQKMTRFLKQLRERLGKVAESQPLSFIERINAKVEEQLAEAAAKVA